MSCQKGPEKAFRSHELRGLRKQLGLRQKELAPAIKLTQGTLSKMEAGIHVNSRNLHLLFCLAFRAGINFTLSNLAAPNPWTPNGVLVTDPRLLRVVYAMRALNVRGAMNQNELGEIVGLAQDKVAYMESPSPYGSAAVIQSLARLRAYDAAFPEFYIDPLASPEELSALWHLSARHPFCDFSAHSPTPHTEKKYWKTLDEIKASRTYSHWQMGLPGTSSATRAKSKFQLNPDIAVASHFLTQ